MTNLSIDDWKLLNGYLGEGPINKAEVIFFGNEFGLAQNDIENYLNYIKKFIKEKKYTSLDIKLKDGFLLYGRDSIVLNSNFVRFCARFMLAHKHDDERFLDSLSKQGDVLVNKYISNELHLVNSVIINMRALPRPSEDSWIYQNINKNSYLNTYRFSSKNHNFDKSVKPRIANILRAFYKAPSPLILSTGDKWNKKNLFERILPNTYFEEISLSTSKKILLDKRQKILLCDYFDKRTLGLASLKEIFNIVRSESILLPK